MVEFTVAAKDFKKAIRFILAGRKEYMDKDTADFVAVADDLELCSTGTSMLFQLRSHKLVLAVSLCRY